MRKYVNYGRKKFYNIEPDRQRRRKKAILTSIPGRVLKPEHGQVFDEGHEEDDDDHVKDAAVFQDH